MITSCYRFMFLPRVRVPKILLGKKFKIGQSKFLKSTLLFTLLWKIGTGFVHSRTAVLTCLECIVDGNLKSENISMCYLRSS